MKPLEGIKIIDFSKILAGPFGTMILGELGAEVIKIETPNGDDSRYWAPVIYNVSIYFLSTNRNKKSIAIHLKKNDGREIVYHMVRDADIVVENFREGVADKLGIGYAMTSVRLIRGSYMLALEDVDQIQSIRRRVEPI